jgi:hypothetical protein
VNFRPLQPPVIVIPLKRLDRATRKALRLGASLSDEVIAVQILSEEMRTDDLSCSWAEIVAQPARQAGVTEPRLAVVSSAYREFFHPLLRHLRRVGDEHPGRPIAVMLPEIVERRWYHFLFHHRATAAQGLVAPQRGPENCHHYRPVVRAGSALQRRICHARCGYQVGRYQYARRSKRRKLGVMNRNTVNERPLRFANIREVGSD